jgi:hypothetical protein
MWSWKEEEVEFNVVTGIEKDFQDLVQNNNCVLKYVRAGYPHDCR